MTGAEIGPNLGRATAQAERQAAWRAWQDLAEAAEQIVSALARHDRRRDGNGAAPGGAAPYAVAGRALTGTLDAVVDGLYRHLSGSEPQLRDDA